jgi:hypothetical protein
MDNLALPLLFYVWKKERQYIFMELDKSDILQINATVMVGVLILLTLRSLSQLNTAAIGPYHCVIIFPFAVSSIMVIISKVRVSTDVIKSNRINAETKSMNLQLFPPSVMATMIGFVYNIVAAIILAYTSFF